MQTQYDLSIRDVAPFAGAVRLTGTTPSGLPSGEHTGGAWLYEGKVYKPLDILAFDCDYHVPGPEAIVLKQMADTYLFPRNWMVEEHNGRRFLVRNVAHIMPVVPGGDYFDRQQVLKIERAVRLLNKRGWEIGDEIAIALDAFDYTPFLYDLSAAQQMPDEGAFAADDTERIERFFELTGNTWLLKLRNNARAAWRALELVPEVLPGEIGKHIYGSMYRPMDSMWAHIPGAQFVQTGRANLSEAMPHTWVVTKEPLPKSTIDRFELSWGWSPIHE